MTAFVRKQSRADAIFVLLRLVLSSHAISADAGYRSSKGARRRSPAIGDLRDSRWPGVRTCFQLRAVLTTQANRASPSQVPAAPPAPTTTRSQSQRKQ